MLRQLLILTLANALMASSLQAGPYSGPTDTTHVDDAAIPSDSALFVEWADDIDASRTDFAPRGSVAINLTGTNSLGDLDADEIAAGEQPGFLTVTFPKGIRNGAGPDFAVFESGFVFPNDPFLFAEFAFVEVSTNGSDFVRFPAISTNTTWAGDFGRRFAGYDVSNVRNLAGKHASGFGTPFDLDELLTDPLVTGGFVDLGNIQYVKLVDIPGNGDFEDSLGNGILDNWLTTGTGGYDFRLAVGQGVGVIHAVPEPMTCGLAALALAVGIMGRRRRTM